MFLPTRIVHVYERIPHATRALVGLNVLVFVLWLVSGSDDYGGYWLDPKNLNPVQFVTSMFLHAGVWHLVGNMIFLWVYGLYVEDRLGPGKFLALYFLSGFAGDLLYLALGNEMPCVGASGAISGLMGFTLVAAPWADVQMIFFLHYRQFADPALQEPWAIPVWWTLGFWLLFQGLMAMGGDSGVAISAHIGGFAFGAGVAWFLRSARCKGTSWYLEEETGGPAAARRLRKARRHGRATRAVPEAAPKHEVVLLGLAADASPVAVVKLLMKRCFLAPETAKEHVDAIRAGDEQAFSFETSETAEHFRDEATALGVEVGAPPKARRRPPGSVGDQ